MNTARQEVFPQTQTNNQNILNGNRLMATALTIASLSSVALLAPNAASAQTETATDPLTAPNPVENTITAQERTAQNCAKSSTTRPKVSGKYRKYERFAFDYDLTVKPKAVSPACKKLGKRTITTYLSNRGDYKGKTYESKMSKPIVDKSGSGKTIRKTVRAPRLCWKNDGFGGADKKYGSKYATVTEVTWKPKNGDETVKKTYKTPYKKLCK